MYRLTAAMDALSVPKTFYNFSKKTKVSQGKKKLTGKKGTKKREKRENLLKENVSLVNCLLDKSQGNLEENVLEIIMTWKQVNFELGPSPTQALYAHGLERGHGHKMPLVYQGRQTSVFLDSYNSYSISNLYFHTKPPRISHTCFYDFARRKLILGNDVETNPGPKVVVKSFNVSGMKDYDKMKRILNYSHNLLKETIGIIILQETHLTKEDETRLNLMWKGKYIISPGTNLARGCAILYAEWHFDKVEFIKGDDDGRTAWMIASKDSDTYMFLGIYGPNKRQDIYYKKIVKEANILIRKHNVSRITFAGDLNLELNPTSGRHVTVSELRARKTLSKFMDMHDISIVSDKEKVTWCRKDRRSVIDYICTNIHGTWLSRTMWGVDRSDHACIEACLNLKSDQGPGIPRIDPTFLEVDTARNAFINGLTNLINVDSLYDR